MGQPTREAIFEMHKKYHDVPQWQPTRIVKFLPARMLLDEGRAMPE